MGVIVEKTCRCGNYKPKSTKGIINLRCKNCGGYKSTHVGGKGDGQPGIFGW